MGTKLFARINSLDTVKAFPAARVSSTLTTYNFGNTVRSGKDYDQVLISENARFITKGALNSCMSYECMQVKKQIDSALFSWWTDLPWVSITHAKRMLSFLADAEQVKG